LKRAHPACRQGGITAFISVYVKPAPSYGHAGERDRRLIVRAL
jgi:hypothetical protein